MRMREESTGSRPSRVAAALPAAEGDRGLGGGSGPRPGRGPGPGSGRANVLVRFESAQADGDGEGLPEAGVAVGAHHGAGGDRAGAVLPGQRTRRYGRTASGRRIGRCSAFGVRRDRLRSAARAPADRGEDPQRRRPLPRSRRPSGPPREGVSENHRGPQNGEARAASRVPAGHDGCGATISQGAVLGCGARRSAVCCSRCRDRATRPHACG